MEDAPETQRLTLEASGPRVRLYAGDTLEMLPTLPDVELATVVVTDPPYSAYKYIRDLEASGHLDPAADARWCEGLFWWTGAWLRALHARLTSDSVGWLFCNVHYLGAYVRWCHLLGWPLRAIYGFGTGEFLLAFGDRVIPHEALAGIDVALRENAYGQGKSVVMLRALIDASPPGLVLDPFCGSGTTLVAACEAGRDTVGLDCDPQAITRSIAALTAGGWLNHTE